MVASGMLTIRDAQMAVLVEERVSHLRAWLLPHLRRHFGDQLVAMSDDDVRALIEHGVARARALGAASSETIGGFVHLRVVFGAALETLPWAAHVLADPDLVGERRLRLLGRRARAALRAEEVRS
jgi:hypothetical protein